MASIKKLDERKFKITGSNGYHPDGKKIAKAKTIIVPKSVQARSIMQYVNHTAEEMEREVKLGYSEDGEMTFEEFALRWLDRQTKYAVSTLNGYRIEKMLMSFASADLTADLLRKYPYKNTLWQSRRC